MDIRLAFLALLVSAGVATGVIPQNDAQPVGMILAVSRDVSVERKGQTNAARLADLLLQGDRLTARGGRISFLFCPSQEQVTLRGTATLQLGPDQMELIEGSAPARTQAGGCALPRVALGRESLERVGGLRARGYPPIVLYLGGSTLNSHPSFEWEPVEKADSYQVALKNALGVVIWEDEAEHTSVAYPESMAPLEKSDYQWEVTAIADGETVAQQRANFSVRPDSELERQMGHHPTDHLVRATPLENAEYFSDAAGHYRELRKAHPDDVRITRRLTWLYWNAGLIAATNQERDQLSSSERQ